MEWYSKGTKKLGFMPEKMRLRFEMNPSRYETHTPTRISLPKKKWEKQYKLHQVETQINKVRTPGKTAKDAINLWKKAEKKANYQRDLYIVIDFLSKDVLKNNLLKLKQSKPFEQKKEAIPMLWLISSLWSSCQELNIRLHITCQK